MIARIRGEVIEHDGTQVVIDCGGVGYAVEVAIDEQSKLAVGTTANLHISENIKDDTYDLFGFSSQSRKELFRLLTSVNGVGPKAGMAVLNIGPEAQVRAAIASGDTKFITAAKGIGKKVAERIIVDLKSKVGFSASGDATGFLTDAPVTDDAVQALMALGFSSQDAVERLRGIDSKMPTEERVKQALKR